MPPAGFKQRKKRVKTFINEFFKSLTWNTVMERLAGKQPLVFIIMNKEGWIHDLIIKDGVNPPGFSEMEIDNLRSSEIPPIIKKRIDTTLNDHTIYKRDLVASNPTPVIVPVESHEPNPPLPAEDKGPLTGPMSLPSIETITPPAPVLKVEDQLPTEDGEVDLQVGMKIVFQDGDREAEGQIAALFEEEGQLLVSRVGTKKKDIIDADKIKRLV